MPPVEAPPSSNPIFTRLLHQASRSFPTQSWQSHSDVESEDLPNVFLPLCRNGSYSCPLNSWSEMSGKLSSLFLLGFSQGFPISLFCLLRKDKSSLAQLRQCKHTVRTARILPCNSQDSFAKGGMWVGCIHLQSKHSQILSCLHA